MPGLSVPPVLALGVTWNIPTVTVTADEVEGALATSPLYAAVYCFGPAVSELTVQVADVPVKGTDEQPARAAPPSVKVTSPVTAVPVTSALSVTLPPTSAVDDEALS